jgi:catechol 2,3-dioxygenase-like lactoylglutathione lyase family enzyme
MSDEIPVTADPPESPISVQGTDHITVIGSNEEDTVAFYRDLLGMPLVLRQPNLDAPETTHLFFDTGDGRILTFFVGDHPSDGRPIQTGIGQVHHLAFRIDIHRLEEVKSALSEAGYRFSEFDRGAFRSLYTRDHNGLTIELVVEKWDLDDSERGRVLALAHANRVEAGDEYVDDEHVDAALDELGIDAEFVELPDAPTGTGME